MRIGLGIASAALVVLSACGGSGGDDELAAPAKAQTFDASGTIKLLATGNEQVAGTCRGKGGYNDISSGAQVVITDANGKRVGIGQLDNGEPGQYQTCAFPFTVSNIPSGKGPYAVEVSHRGEVAFDEVTANMLSLSLG